MGCHDSQFGLEDLFKENSVCFRVYIALETIQDPFEKNVVLDNLNPIPMRALFLQDFTTTQISWKIPGIKTSRAKEFLIEKRNKSLLENSQKIEYDGKFYEGWRENGRLQYREEGNFLRIIIFSKHTEL